MDVCCPHLISSMHVWTRLSRKIACRCRAMGWAAKGLAGPVAWLVAWAAAWQAALASSPTILLLWALVPLAIRAACDSKTSTVRAVLVVPALHNWVKVKSHNTLFGRSISKMRLIQLIVDRLLGSQCCIADSGA